METLFSIVMYLLVVSLFIAFGKFVKERDNSASNTMMNETKIGSRRDDPARTLV